MDFGKPVELGTTGLSVGRLGVGAGYGAAPGVYEMAFERGCNYFYWTSPKPGMQQAVKNIRAKGGRDNLVMVLQSYSRSAWFLEKSVKKGLKALGLDHADILILGWHNREPSRRIIDKALMLKEKGLYRFLGLSGHNRSLFPKLAAKGVFDLFHVRYNAAHRGAETEIFPNLPTDNKPGIVSYTATRWGHLVNPKKMPQGETPPQARDCYRFALSNPQVDVCLCGPRNMAQMTEALAALETGPLGAQEMQRMCRIGDHVHTRGGFFM